MSVHWNKSYTYYNNGQFAERQLNLFQRGLRVLGFYSNTRLAKVAQVAIESFYKQGAVRNEPLLDLAKKAITSGKIRGEFHIKQSDEISIRGKFFPNERTLFIVYSESSKVQTSLYVQPFLNEKLFINQLETINESPLNDLSLSFIQKLLTNTEKSRSIRLQGSNVGTEDSARACDFEGKTLENGLELTKNYLPIFGHASQHTISMDAFFRPKDLEN